MAAKKPSATADESKVWALLAYLLGIVGFLLVLVAKKHDRFAWYHAKQSLVLFIAWIIVYVVGMVTPVVGWFIIWPVGNLAALVLWIIGMVNAATGKQKPLPIIGHVAGKMHID